jgi:hypothetical protein
MNLEICAAWLSWLDLNEFPPKDDSFDSFLKNEPNLYFCSSVIIFDSTSFVTFSLVYYIIFNSDLWWPLDLALCKFSMGIFND